MGIIKWFGNMNKDYKDRQVSAERSRQGRKAHLEDTNELYCPVCLSTHIIPVKKGYSVKKGVVGAVLFGGVGLVGGAIGANDLEMRCLGCGETFKVRK